MTGAVVASTIPPQQIVGQAGGRAGQEGGGGRSHHDGIGPACPGDMVHAVGVQRRPLRGGNRVSRQRLKLQGRNESLPPSGQHPAHLVPALDQETGQFGSPVSGNRSGNSQDDAGHIHLL